MRKLVFHDLAKKDLRLIREYTFRTWGIEQSKKYLKGLNLTLQLIKQKPLLGNQKLDIQENAFSFVYKSHIIYYQFDVEKVVIAAVLHQSMLLKEHLTGRTE